MNKDIFALICTAAITVGFLVAGIFNVLDYLIVKAILFGVLAGLILLVIVTASSKEKNHQSED